MEGMVRGPLRTVPKTITAPMILFAGGLVRGQLLKEIQTENHLIMEPVFYE
jgi:hypothetical protein